MGKTHCEVTDTIGGPVLRIDDMPEKGMGRTLMHIQPPKEMSGEIGVTFLRYALHNNWLTDDHKKQIVTAAEMLKESGYVG